MVDAVGGGMRCIVCSVIYGRNFCPRMTIPCDGMRHVRLLEISMLVVSSVELRVVLEGAKKGKCFGGTGELFQVVNIFYWP